jgi:hypothetical protein
VLAAELPVPSGISTPARPAENTAVWASRRDLLANAKAKNAGSSPLQG